MGSTSPREPASLGLESRILKPELRLHVRHDFQARILERSQAIRVEDQMLLKLLRHR